MENNKDNNEVENVVNGENNAVETSASASQTAEKSEKKEKSSFFSKKNGNKEKEQKFQERISALEAEKAELNERFLRLFSEFDNYKKRTNKEKLEIIATASERVIAELLPVIDDFERAIQANEKIDDIQVVKDGFSLIYSKLQQLLKHFDVTEIEALGATFDTDVHEAVTHFPTADEADKGKVIDVISKGYKIKEKVIRFSKVVVAN